MSRFKYSIEMIAFLEVGYKKWRIPELTKQFNAWFKLKKTEGQIKSALTNNGIKANRPTGLSSCERKLKYSEEQIDWLKSTFKEVSVKELVPRFNQEFGLNETFNQVKAFLKNHGITSGRTGHFTKGHESWNKGKKGLSTGGEAGWFKKGCTPPNRKPLGHERICSKDGYVMVKVAEKNPHTGHATRFRQKHRVVWEQHNGPVPKGMALIFKDGNKLNCAIDNLMLIDRAQLAVMNKSGLIYAPAKMKEMAALTAKLIIETNKKAAA